MSLFFFAFFRISEPKGEACDKPVMRSHLPVFKHTAICQFSSTPAPTMPAAKVRLAKYQREGLFPDVVTYRNRHGQKVKLSLDHLKNEATIDSATNRFFMLLLIQHETLVSATGAEERAKEIYQTLIAKL